MFKNIKNEIDTDFSAAPVLLTKKDITVFTLKLTAISLAAGFAIAFMPEIVNKLMTTEK